MNMYNINNDPIGTKTIQQGKGLQMPDGSFGNSVTMKFNNTTQKQNRMINTLAQTQQKQSFTNNYPNGIKPPLVHLELDNNNKEIGNFLQYLADKRNAAMIQKYDEMNMKNNQFLKRLSNSKFQSKQNRYQQQLLQQQRLKQQQKQFNKTFDFNVQKFDITHDFEMQKYLHPQNITDSSEKYKLERTKIFTKDPSSLVPEWEDLDEKTKIQVRDSYINNGTIPKLESSSGWFGDVYRIAGENNQQGQQYEAERVVGNKKFIKKDGEWYEI